MAEVKLNPVFEGMSGKAGDIVFFCRYGKQYARAYVIPKNPDTEAQRINRHIFAEAVEKWQNLSRIEKEMYNKKTRQRSCSGYNLFISLYIKRRKNRAAFTPIKSGAVKYHRQKAAPSHTFLTTPFHYRYRPDTRQFIKELLTGLTCDKISCFRLQSGLLKYCTDRN